MLCCHLLSQPWRREAVKLGAVLKTPWLSPLPWRGRPCVTCTLPRHSCLLFMSLWGLVHFVWVLQNGFFQNQYQLVCSPPFLPDLEVSAGRGVWKNRTEGKDRALCFQTSALFLSKSWPKTNGMKWRKGKVRLNSRKKALTARSIALWRGVPRGWAIGRDI